MKKRVIINPVPQAQSGLEVKMGDLRAGLGFNANKLPWPVMAGKLSAPDIEVNSTLKPVPREDANLEAEKGEVAALPTKSGIPDTFKIGGKRHHSGGTPLNLPSDSFIFSDTAAMRIKDPTILAQFGMSVKGAGYIPAEIAKKYDVNQFKKVLADPDSEKLQKATAEMMIGNYNLKLAKLAILQESMKGFPQGIPAVAMPYIEEMGIDPAQFVQMNPGGAQTEQASTQQTQMDDVGAEAQGRFGGFMQHGGDYRTEAEYKAHLLDPYSPEKREAQINWNKKRSGLETASQFIPGYETYLDLKDIYEGLREADKEKLNRGIIGLDAPFSTKAVTNSLDYVTEKLLGHTAANEMAAKRNGVINMSQSDLQKLYLKYGPGGYDKWAKDGFPKLEMGGDVDYFDKGGYKSEAEYKAHLLDPYSPEKKAAQIAWLKSQQALPGLRPTFGTSNSFEKENAFRKAYPDAYNMYEAALKSKDPERMQQAANWLNATDVKNSWGWLPWTDQDKHEDLANILEEERAKILNPNKGYYSEYQPQDEQTSKMAYQLYSNLLKKADTIKDKTSPEYYALMQEKDKLFEYLPEYKNLPTKVFGQVWRDNQWDTPRKKAGHYKEALPESELDNSGMRMYSDEENAYIKSQFDAYKKSTPTIAAAQPGVSDYEDITSMKPTKEEIEMLKKSGEKFIINGVKYN